MYNMKTLDVKPEDIKTDQIANQVMKSKLVTATENMAKWVINEKNEHAILRARLMGMMKIITGSDEDCNHEELMPDMSQTFFSSESEHLEVPGRSWTAHHQPAESMSSDHLALISSH